MCLVPTEPQQVKLDHMGYMQRRTIPNAPRYLPAKQLSSTVPKGSMKTVDRYVP